MDNQRRYSPRLRQFILVGLGVIALLTIACSWLAYDRAAAQTASRPAAAASQTDILRPSAAYTLYLPIIYHTLALQQPIFGVQMSVIADTHGLTRVVESHSNWVRAAGVNWAAVETAEGVYDWNALGSNAVQWQRASVRGIRPIVIVGGTPSWARAYADKACGAIRADKLAAFGNFMHELAKRYSKPPYNIKYWEIWNEPDVDPSLVPGDSSFGCWGNQADDYYGGGYYGQMLQAIYPRIKAADPNAQVLIGGLLLDCDPNNPPAGKDCKAARFFEGILRQSGGAYFDGVAIHAYDAYGGALGAYFSPNWHTSSSSTTGPTLALEAKLDYVRGLMSTYGVTGKFIVNNESGVGLFSAPHNTYQQTKAYYVAQVYAAAAAEHLLANIWFSLDDTWRHQELLGTNYAPWPAYYAYKFAAEQLAYARYVSPLTGYAGVKGYVFDVQGHDLWLLWSQDGAVHPLTLPGTPVSIRDVDGTAVTVTGNQLSVGPEPLYVEWAP